MKRPVDPLLSRKTLEWGKMAHVIAGSVEVLCLVLVLEVTLGRYLAGFLLPSFLRNTAGGVALVAALNYGQAFGARAQSWARASGPAPQPESS